MTEGEKMRCETCVHWQDYSDRVYAKVSSAPKGSVKGMHELRQCRYAPPPVVETTHLLPIYTDKGYCCSQWRPA